MTGKEADEILGTVNITANKNAIPFDKQKPFIASGVRVGTPAVTTRGLVEKDMLVIADVFEDALIKKDLDAARAKVKALTDEYPMYTDIIPE